MRTLIIILSVVLGLGTAHATEKIIFEKVVDEVSIEEGIYFSGEWVVEGFKSKPRNYCTIKFQANTGSFFFELGRTQNKGVLSSTSITITANHVNWESGPEDEERPIDNEHTYYLIFDKTDHLNKKLISGEYNYSDDNPYIISITKPINELVPHLRKTKNIELFVKHSDTSISIPVRDPSVLLKTFDLCEEQINHIP